MISAIIPDHEMPHDRDGTPFEVLANPLGVISRCYDEQTEFLTQRGWIFGRDIRNDDRFVCYHVRTEGLFVLDQLTEFHVADYSGKMLKFQNKLMDFCVTPNHRMWAACGYAGAPWQEVTAERIAGRKGWKVPIAGNPVPGDDTHFVLPQIEYHVKDTQTNRDAITIDAKDWATFLGWYMAEGNSDEKVHLSQSASANPENCRKIAALLDRMPFAWNYNRTNTQFHITSKRLCAYLQPFGLCHEKFIPEWVFNQSPETRQCFLDAYLAGDGSKDISERARDYAGAGTMSRQLAEDLQRLLIYQGCGSNVAIQPASGMWRTAIYLKRHRILERQNWEEIDYDGKIYCPTVPTGYVVTRRNGKVLIAGNTNPAQMAEAWLGKIAARTGQPYRVEDFGTEPDMMQHVRRELAAHGLSSTEDIVDPTLQRVIPGIATGNRFFMKLHHSAESKVQSRGSGAYSMDEAPAKGGETGCFAGETPIVMLDEHGVESEVPIGTVVLDRLNHRARAYDPISGNVGGRPVVDWFRYYAPCCELITITLANDRSFTVTRNHEMILADGTKVMAGDLEQGDDLKE